MGERVVPHEPLLFRSRPRPQPLGRSYTRTLIEITGPTETNTVTLFTATGCHLCERARTTLVDVLGDSGFEEIDITGNDELEARHREWLPVVEIDGRRAFVYHVEPDALRRKLAQSRR